MEEPEGRVLSFRQLMEIIAAKCSATSRSLILRLLVLSSLLAITLGLGACSSSDPDDVIIGTGIVLKGTASENRQFANNEVDVRAQSGEASVGIIAQDGQYLADKVTGTGPWLVRSDLGNNEYRFGIAFGRDVAHIHSYTDITLRNWFLREHSVQDINSVFEDENNELEFPTKQVFQTLALQLLAYIDLAIESYELEPQQLLNDEFRADNTGIDLFLDRNPVVLSNQTIEILLTDPTTETQSVNQPGLTLGDEFVQNDTDVPTTPNNIKALGSTATEIVLVWNPSVDNTAVVGYRIYRDGTLLDSTPYPVYTDSSVTPSTQYEYQIEAFDLANNASDRSNVVAGSPTVVGNNNGSIPPVVPTDVRSIAATTSRVQLGWSQSNIENVVAFNVFRGDNGAQPSFLIKVTANGFTDASVVGGTEYCYQVEAINALGTVSPKTDQLCVLTTGIAIDVPVTTPTIVPPLAGLSIPDTEALSCNTPFSNYSISSATTITAGCYQVEQDIVVLAGARLTLEPGVVLKFAANTALLVEKDGSFESLGLATNPVVLTGAQAQLGYWSGVSINRSDNLRNKIIHTVIEYTGSGPLNAALNLNSSVSEFTRIAIDNSLIRLNDRAAINFLRQGTRISSFSGNLITQNRAVGAVGVENIASINDGSEFVDNTDQVIGMARLVVDGTIVIPNLGVPISTNGIEQDSGTIVVEAGVELQFEPGSVLLVKENLLVEGTAAEPVVFTSFNDVPGDWLGVHLVEGANAQLSNLLIEHGGEAGFTNSVGANLFADDARLSLTNVTLRESTSYGLRFGNNNVIVDNFDRINISDNAIAARVGVSSLDVLTSSTTLMGNTADRIDVEPVTSTADVTWPNTGFDYRIDGRYNFIGGSLTIDPGVVIKAAPSTELIVGGIATLNLVGTADSPIILEADQLGQGGWSGIVIQSDTLNTINHAVIQGAGGASPSFATGETGAIRVTCSAASPASLSMANTRIEDSAGWGVLLEGAGCNLSIGSGMQYFRNILGDRNF